MIVNVGHLKTHKNILKINAINLNMSLTQIQEDDEFIFYYLILKLNYYNFLMMLYKTLLILIL